MRYYIHVVLDCLHLFYDNLLVVCTVAARRSHTGVRSAGNAQAFFFLNFFFYGCGQRNNLNSERKTLTLLLL